MTEDSLHDAPRSAVDDMLADLGVGEVEAHQLRGVLGQVAGLANEVPEPSDEVRALLDGAVPLSRRRHRVLLAAAAGALAFGGVSAAAATNRLPDPIQEIAANAADGVLPVDIPHPVKPVDPPTDAPGHVKDHDDKNDDAPGQIQKDTKPDPTAPGPAHPADPGSHGRAHHPDANDGSGVERHGPRD